MTTTTKWFYYELLNRFRFYDSINPKASIILFASEVHMLHSALYIIHFVVKIKRVMVYLRHLCIGIFFIIMFCQFPQALNPFNPFCYTLSYIFSKYLTIVQTFAAGAWFWVMLNIMTGFKNGSHCRSDKTSTYNCQSGWIWG